MLHASAHTAPSSADVAASLLQPSRWPHPFFPLQQGGQGITRLPGALIINLEPPGWRAQRRRRLGVAAVLLLLVIRLVRSRWESMILPYVRR